MIYIVVPDINNRVVKPSGHLLAITSEIIIFRRVQKTIIIVEDKHLNIIIDMA